MCENQIGCLLVGDQDGNAAGIVTDRDFVCRWSTNFGGKDVPISEIMSRDLVTADESSSLSDVVNLMERYGIRRVPIVHKPNGRSVFLGIVTLDDLLASHQLEANQLSRVIRRQVGRRMAFITEHVPVTARTKIRSEAHQQQAVDQFYTFLAKATGLNPVLLPVVTRFIIGSLLMRVTFTTASHLLSQLPQLVREPLSKLPPGPDRSYTVERILQELSSRFHFDEEQARATFHRVLFSLKVPMALKAMEHVEAQLPQDFRPFFEPISLDTIPPRTEPEVPTAKKTQPQSKAASTFSDRTQAAENLAKHLEHYKGQNALVLGIPRGSVPMARIIANKLQGELDVVLVHKIGAPGNPEFAVGSVSEFGTSYQSPAIEFYEISSEYFNHATQEEITKLQKRRKAYSPIRPPIDPKNRVVIIVDDGIATGATMLAAIRAIRSQGAKKIVVAAPVAAPSAAESLTNEADEVVVLETPEDFFSISQFYDDFPQVSDEEVLHALSAAEKPKSSQVA